MTERESIDRIRDLMPEILAVLPKGWTADLFSFGMLIIGARDGSCGVSVDTKALAKHPDPVAWVRTATEAWR